MPFGIHYYARGILFLDVPETKTILGIWKRLRTVSPRRRFWKYAKEGENLENLKNVDDFGEEKGIVQLRKTENEKMKNLQGRIKKLEIEIEKWAFKGLIIDRSKSQQEIEI